MTIAIAGRPIGPEHPPYVIAEMSCNHLGSLTRARELVHAAAESGADAIKLQTYTADTMTLPVSGPGFDIHGGLWDGRRLYELYEEAHTPWEWHAELFDLASKHGIACFSSPFDASAVALLAGLGAPAYKIASFEVVDLPLIAAAASHGKPLVISTGMADLAEIADAVETAGKAGAGGIALLHAISGYPTPPEQFNLATVAHLAQAFGFPVGISDHTLGIAVPVAAVALGARLIEKHIILSRNDGGPDAAFSSEPKEIAEMVVACRQAASAVGAVTYKRAVAEQPNAVFRRSLYVTADMRAGEPFTPASVRSIRPALGLPPKHLPLVLTRRAARDLKRGEPLDWAALGPEA